MTLADLGDTAVEVWPDNQPALGLFLRLRTQWRVGPGGAVGLDYGVMYRMMDRLNLPADEYDELEADVAVMEAEALDVMHSA